VKVLYTIYIKKNTPTKEIIEPKELTAFQPAKASGKSLYLLGNPDNPKKCCGKKVTLTPINIVQKWILPKVSG